MRLSPPNPMTLTLQSSFLHTFVGLVSICNAEFVDKTNLHTD